jgi:hypothetical protein
VKRLLVGILGLLALACAGTHRDDRVPKGDGPLIALYKAAIDDGHGAKRGAKLSVWAATPDRLHVELIAPVGGVTFTLDAGDGNACVVDVGTAIAYVGDGGPGAIEALVGVRLSIQDAVAALLYGVTPPGASVTRIGGPEGALPERFRFADGARSLTLDRIRLERGSASSQALGTGIPPRQLAVRPLASLAQESVREAGPRDGDR